MPVLTVIGLMTAQVIATIQVGWSNHLVFHRMQAVREAGYLAVPNDQIEPALRSLKAALGGGLFFTLTIGALMTLLTVGGLQLIKGPFGWRKSGLFAVMAVGIGGLVLVNLNGFNLFATAYLIGVPFVICLAAFTGGWPTKETPSALGVLCLICPPVLLAILGAPLINQQMFSDIRDQVLLSNSPGRTVNAYYYRYTLYPTEAFKSLAQKQIRTVYLSGFDDAALISNMTKALVPRDYLPVATKKYGEVVITSVNADFMVLEASGKKMPVSNTTFINQTGQVLQSLADLADTNQWFRKIVFISLLSGFPLLIYVIVFGAARRGLAWVFPDRFAIIAAAIICIGLGMGLIRMLGVEKPVVLAGTHPDLTAITDQRQRLAVLKAMDDAGIDLTHDPAYPRLMTSPWVVERYRLARLLAHSCTEKTYHDLIRMLADPSPNVVCMALWSLGKRGDEQAVAVILNRMRSTDHWYVQMYAYNALKSLGWRQPGLN